jgi:cobalt-zinc-cadmium efflux system protein
VSAGHGHSVRAGRRHLKPLTIAFILVIVFMVAEAVAGWLTGSLALISDAGHMATDGLGLGMALAAILAADKLGDQPRRTFGLYRSEILAALANAVLLFAVAGYVLYEAIQRLDSPPEILAGPMALVAVAGLIVNLVAWRLLRRGADESLNVEGAYVEVLADLIGSIGVLAAAAVIWATGWTIVDPIVAAAIGLFILPRAWRLGRKAVRILIQAAPDHLDLEDLRLKLMSIPDVVNAHDLHVWTLTSDMDVATVHLTTSDDTDPHTVLDQARSILQDHGIAHATLQVEPESHDGCEELSW